MKFYDKVSVKVISGKWWDGVVSARRETWVPYWGPAGWNGGKWGSVVFVWNQNITTLVDFHYKRILEADDGDPGRTKEQYGKNAEDLIIQLPLWSIVRDATTGAPLWQCIAKNDQYVIARGGQWGIGNMHFKNAIQQYPQFALLWEPGESKEIEIELQLLADVALIGTPSVGKSSLINAIANVKAKVADYPFTTLIPNLWSVKHHDATFNVVDVPGLIAGASEWKWLWNEFLRHIMKARILCFMVDMSRYEQGMDEFGVLCDELVRYLQRSLQETRDYWILEDVRVTIQFVNDHLQLVAEWLQAWVWGNVFVKDILLIANKSDVLGDEEVIHEYIEGLRKTIATYLKARYKLTAKWLHIYEISTYSRIGIDKRLDDLVEQYIPAHPEVVALSVEEPDPKQNDSIEIRETTAEDLPVLIERSFVDAQDVTYAKVRYIAHREVTRLVYMIPWGNDEAEMRFWNVLDKKRILQKLVTAGMVKGDIIHVHSFYTGQEDRFIRY